MLHLTPDFKLPSAERTLFEVIDDFAEAIARKKVAAHVGIWSAEELRGQYEYEYSRAAITKALEVAQDSQKAIELLQHS